MGASRAAFYVFAAISLTGLLAGCGGIHKPFNLMNEQGSIEPRAIAVIAGSQNPEDIRLAEYLTTQLAERTKFKVLTQEEIGRRVSGYPNSTLIEWDRDYGDDDEKVVWVLPKEMGKVNAIQSRLRVDYVYVVWIRAITRISGGNSSPPRVYAYPAGNLIAYPGARIVASTRMTADVSESPLKLFRPKDYYVLKAIEYGAEEIVDEMIASSRSLKK